jgi:hypothetical protein
MFRYDGSYDGPNFANLGYPATIELFRAFLLPHVDHFTRPALNCPIFSLMSQRPPSLANMQIAYRASRGVLAVLMPQAGRGGLHCGKRAQNEAP